MAPGAEAVFIPLDVTSWANIQQAIAATVAQFGRLDVALNNAGIGEGFFSFLDTSEESFQRIIDVNLTGVFVCMKYELAQFVQQGGGVMVNMSSLAGLKGAPGLSAYVAQSTRLAEWAACPPSRTLLHACRGKRMKIIR